MVKEVSERVRNKPTTELQAQIQREAGRIGHFLITSNGDMKIKDQHVDIFSRVVFPIAYSVYLAFMFEDVAN